MKINPGITLELSDNELRAVVTALDALIEQWADDVEDDFLSETATEDYYTAEKLLERLQ